MGLNRNFTRIDTVELQTLVMKKIGRQKSEKYFDQLKRLLTLKVSKREFDRFCIRTLGRENIALHNRLIGAIIKNAHFSKVPPSNGGKSRGSLNVKIANGYQRNSLQALYGDAFPPSPRKGRSHVNRDRKFRDRPSPLGPFGKPQSVAGEESVSKAREQQSATELHLHSLGSRPPVEVISVEDGEEVEQMAGSPGVQSRSPVTAPLGISMNLGGARKALHNGSVFNYQPVTCQSSGELPDTRSLRSRLENQLEMKGMNVSIDCVNLLNNGLDAYLKRLIEPAMRLAASRSGNEQFQQLNGQIVPGMTVNGGHFYAPARSVNVSMEDFCAAMDKNPQIVPGMTVNGEHSYAPTRSVNVSMEDFCAAMDMNPQILGEDWTIQRERVQFYSWQEQLQ